MKKEIKTIIVGLSIVYLTLSAVPVYGNGDGSHGLQWKTPFMGVLTYGQVPNPDPQEGATTPSNASGLLFAYLNHLTNELVFSINYRDLQGGIIMVHFHGPAVPGDFNANHFFDVCCKDDDPYSEPPEGNQGTFDGKTTPLTSSQIRNLKKGLWYLNIHTDLFPTAEIRGQVLPSGIQYLRYNP
jgi:hypothetical protein